MKLEEIAAAIEYMGTNLAVIPDAPLLEWARSLHLSPREAQLQALRAHIIPERYLRNFHTFDIDRQIWLCESKVLICGCGGLGGVLSHLLARAGVGLLRLVDGDEFAATNFNRQWFCETGSLGRAKVQETAEHLQVINPFVLVQAVPENLTESNAAVLLEGVDLVLDALDNIAGRLVLAQAARGRGLPFIHGAAAGWLGQIATFLPNSAKDLTSVYGSRQNRGRAELGLGILGTTTAVIGALQAAEAIRLLTGAKPAYADALFYFAGESGLTELIPL
jgi:molybdopterin-synthase adenylyltransferase